MTMSAEEIIASVKASLNKGDLLLAFDRARDGLKLFPDCVDLKHQGVLALARAGATKQATWLYQDWGLDASDDDDVTALGARLLKDGALSMGGEARRQALMAAAAAYAATNGRTLSYYRRINQATLLFLAGAMSEAREAAELVLADDSLREPVGYYDYATRSEALLLLERLPEAAENLSRAASAADGGFGAKGATRRQFRLILEAAGRSRQEIDGFLSPVMAPPILHYTASALRFDRTDANLHLAPDAAVWRAITAKIEEVAPVAAYGLLAPGAELLFAEALLSAGVELHVVLPCRLEHYMDKVVRPAGAQWVERFEACLASSANCTYAAQDGSALDGELTSHAARIATGLAVLRSQYLDSEAVQFALHDAVGEDVAAGQSGGNDEVAAWRRLAGQRQFLFPIASGAALPEPSTGGAATARSRHAIVFGDLPSFSNMPDSQLPDFWTIVMGAIGEAVVAHRDKILLKNTWGDAVHFIIQDVRSAAELCLDIQERLGRVDKSQFGLDRNFSLRIGAHFAPIATGWDPVCGRDTYFGQALSHAARIEPIAPPGEVYVTEAFAAIAALEAGDSFACSYVGKVPLAKNHGEFRMYRLSARVPAGRTG